MDVIVFDEFYFYADSIFGIFIFVLIEVHSDDFLHIIFIFLVLPQKVLNVFVLGQRELSIRQDW